VQTCEEEDFPRADDVVSELQAFCTRQKRTQGNIVRLLGEMLICRITTMGLTLIISHPRIGASRCAARLRLCMSGTWHA
jgi:uncharacterized Fe-S cluster-containing protein